MATLPRAWESEVSAGGHCVRHFDSSFLGRMESGLQWLVHGRLMAIDGVIQPEKLLADLVDHRET